MESKNKDSSGIWWLVMAGFVAIAAIGGTYALVKTIQKADDKVNQDQSSMVDQGNSTNTTSSTPSTSTSGGNTSSGTTSSGGDVITTSPTINVNKREITWRLKSTDSFPTDSFIFALSGLPANATDAQKQLYLYCDDDTMPNWIDLWTVSNGTNVPLTSPYVFKSGDTIFVKAKKHPQPTDIWGTWYKIPLWGRSSVYTELDLNVDINIYTTDL